MLYSLSSFANTLPNGGVRGNKVAFSTEHALSQKTPSKRNRRDATLFVNGYRKDGTPVIGINLHEKSLDVIAVRDAVCRKLGVIWKPQKKKPKGHDPIAFRVRNMFVGETLQVCRYRHWNGQKVAPEWFALLANDVMRPATEANKTWVGWYGAEFGLEPAKVEQIIEQVLSHTWKDCRGKQRKGPRNYTADERAVILGMTYAERQLLELRRTGAVDVDKRGRERARRDRYNVKRRAERAMEKEGRIRCQTSCGVNRLIPSSQGDVLSDSEDSESPRIPLIRVKTSEIIKIVSEKPPSRPPPRPGLRPESVPFAERVGLMMRHCGLSRAEAEAEAMKWIH